MKYTVNVHKGGSYSPNNVANVNELKQLLSYLLTDVEVGKSLNITIVKNHK